LKGGSAAEFERARTRLKKASVRVTALDESLGAGGAGEDGPSTDAATIAKWILDGGDRFACDEGGRLYVYRDGTYYADGERRVHRRTKEYFTQLEIEEEWTHHRANEVTEYLIADCNDLWAQPPLDAVNVRNGLLDIRKLIETGQLDRVRLREHDPEHLSPVQLPLYFDPAARCPAWEKFISEVFPEDAQDLPWQILAWLMVPFTGIQKAVLLMGEGGTGKSTFLSAVKTFLGRRNVSAKSLHRLESCRFSVGGLVGKLANICADLPGSELAGTSVFKAITGGDELTGEHKFKDEFTFLPFCRLLFSANKPPLSPDATEAFFERWIVVAFDRKFRGVEGREIPRHKLDAVLGAPAELSGVLNRALAMVPGVLERGITIERSMKEAHAAFRASTDPILVWLETNVLEHVGSMVGKQTLRSAYNAQAGGRGLPPACAL
jgi:putative DNA primase/helicase